MSTPSQELLRPMLKIVLTNTSIFSIINDMRTWTDEEIRYLRKYYNNTPMNIIVGQLGRSPQSIRNKVHYMRRKGMKFDRVTDAKR